MAYTATFAIALTAGDTGLTLKAQLVTTAGVNYGSEILTGFTEIGAGNYIWHYTAFPDNFRGGVKIISGAATFQAFAAINPEDVEEIAETYILVQE